MHRVQNERGLEHARNKNVREHRVYMHMFQISGKRNRTRCVCEGASDFFKGDRYDPGG